MPSGSYTVPASCFHSVAGWRRTWCPSGLTWPYELGIAPVAREPPFGFHAGPYYVADIDTHLPRLADYTGLALAPFDGQAWLLEETDRLEPFLSAGRGDRVWVLRFREDGWCLALNACGAQGWFPTPYWRITPPRQPPRP